MKLVSTDQNGEDWEICWGVLDEEATLRNEFGISGPFKARPEHATFQDPIYKRETKSLRVYESTDGTIVAMSEITPSIYAAGVKK